MNISNSLKNIFGNTKCVIAFRKSTSLKQIIERNTIEKKFKKPYTIQNIQNKSKRKTPHRPISMLQVNNTQINFQ